MNTVERFWFRVDKSGDCWLWTGYKAHGYGRIMIDGKNIRTHRRSWELHYGAVPPGFLVCHACDNPGCVRPDHLFLGTHQDNVSDKMAKGRHRCGDMRGPANGKAVLTEQLVRNIRGANTAGESARAIARRLGVSNSTIFGVLTGRTWSHIK